MRRTLASKPVRALACATAAAALLTACDDPNRSAPPPPATATPTPADSSSPTPTGSPSASAPATTTVDPGPRSGPAALIGAWLVEGAGVDPGTVLTMSAGELQLTRACGTSSGSWRAAESLFVAHVTATPGGCPSGTAATPAWLGGAAVWRVDDLGPALEDRSGKQLARLTPAPDVTVTPTPVDESFAKPAPLPTSLKPASVRQLAGRWEPAGGKRPTTKTRPHITLAADGTWRGSDGCNESGGRWVADRGTLIATSGPTTLIGCPGVDVPGWLAGTTRAGFRGSELVLVDAKGKALGRLRRARP